MYGFIILGEISNAHTKRGPIRRKICILRSINNLTIYDILELWHFKRDGPLMFIMYLSDPFTHITCDCFIGIRATVSLSQCQ